MIDNLRLWLMLTKYKMLNFNNKRMTDEEKYQKSDVLINTLLSTSTKLALEEFYKQDKPVVILTCPHCGVSGGKGGMIQWHFNRCKEKPVC